MSETRLGGLLVAISAAGYATIGIFARFAYAGGATVLTTLAARFILAALLLWVVAWLFRLPPVPRQRRLPLLLLGSLVYAGMSFFFFAAAERIPVSLTVLLLYLYPVFVTLVNRFLEAARFGPRHRLALILAVGGLWLLLSPGLRAVDSFGVLLGFCAALVYTVYVVWGERVVRGLSPLSSTAWVTTGASLTTLLVGTTTSQLGWRLAASAWWGIWGLVLISTLLAVMTFFYGLPRVGSFQASIISTLEPLVAILLASLVLDERLTLLQALGGGIVLSGVILVQLPPGRRADHPLTSESGYKS